MKIRRCAILLIEPRERISFRLELLMEGGTGLDADLRWIALAPHLDAEVELDAAEVVLLGEVGRTNWVDARALHKAHGAKLVKRLVAKGLLISDAPAGRATRKRDEALRRAHWHAPAAVLHLLGRWEDVRTGEEARKAGLGNMVGLVGALGAPPPAVREHRAPADRIPLAKPTPNAFDALLKKRTTCRNFAGERPVPRAAFEHLMHRVFAAQASFEIEPGTVVLKKNTPSGGGMHPIEPYLFVQNVEGIAPGLYHYHALDHSLERLREMTPAAIRRATSLALGGQEYFADAPAIVVLAARFQRTFWKYRNHTKGYRAVVLEAGHLSQMVYITATELGMGAFVSAAVNEVNIERTFRLDKFAESPVALCGFGYRAAEKTTVEFDPLNAIWKDGSLTSSRAKAAAES